MEIGKVWKLFSLTRTYLSYLAMFYTNIVASERMVSGYHNTRSSGSILTTKTTFTIKVIEKVFGVLPPRSGDCKRAADFSTDRSQEVTTFLAKETLGCSVVWLLSWSISSWSSWYWSWFSKYLEGLSFENCYIDFSELNSKVLESYDLKNKVENSNYIRWKKNKWAIIKSCKSLNGW